MIVSTNQPYFAPYPGFFYKAQISDIFVILDDVQFPRKSKWITRNRFKNDQGTLWMTIPVWKKGLGLQRISNVRICYNGNWHRKHLRSLQSAYAKAPFLADNIGIMEQILSQKFDRLLDLNLEIIKYIFQYLGIETKMMLMSELSVSGKGASLVIDICKSLGATQFSVQSSALSYYDRRQFKAERIDLISFSKPEYIYPQMWGDFIANLSILDMMFTCGSKTREIVLV